MYPSPTFVFLLHSPVPELSQLDRIEQGQKSLHTKLDILSGRMALLLKGLADDDDDGKPSTTLDGTPAGQERDTTQGLG